MLLGNNCKEGTEKEELKAINAGCFLGGCNAVRKQPFSLWTASDWNFFWSCTWVHSLQKIPIFFAREKNSYSRTSFPQPPRLAVTLASFFPYKTDWEIAEDSLLKNNRRQAYKEDRMSLKLPLSYCWDANHMLNRLCLEYILTFYWALRDNTPA